MNLPKAIEILEEIVRARSFTRSKEPTEAIKLGIEALEYVQRDRRGLSDYDIELLPGETEE